MSYSLLVQNNVLEKKILLVVLARGGSKGSNLKI